jgi:hypothetical protein
MLDILRSEEMAVEFNEFLQRASNMINRHQREGAVNEARRLVSELRVKIQKMPEGYWKRKYLDTVQEQFGHLIDGRAGAPSLSPVKFIEGEVEPALDEDETRVRG